MNNNLLKLKCIAFFFAGIFVASVPVTASADWSIKGLGTLGGIKSIATDINNSGQVVGSYNGPDSIPHAFVTGPNGSDITDLGTLGGIYSSANGINDSGQVVGVASFGYPNTHAFMTGPNGVGIIDLGFLSLHPGGDSEFTYSEAYAINNSGQVVGIDGGEPYIQAFITGPNGVGMTQLTYPIEGPWVWSRALDNNDSGQVTGYLQNGTQVLSRPFITGPNGMGISVLDNLGGSNSYATSINNSGQVVGTSSLPGDTVYHAFITGQNGIGITDLLVDQGGIFSVAIDINNLGQVIGDFSTGDGVSHPFLLSNDVIIDLSTLPSVIESGWSNLNPSAINDNGQIVGSGKFHGHTEAFLLSPFPVPEPEIYAMLLAGLGLMGFMAHRRKESAT